MNKLFLLTIVVCATILSVAAKNNPLLVSYQKFFNGKAIDQSELFVQATEEFSHLYYSVPEVEKLIPGYAYENTYVNYSQKLIINNVKYDDGAQYYTQTSLDSIKEPEWSQELRTIEGFMCKKASITINSNKVEIWYTEDAGVNGSPYSGIARVPGLVLSVVRNGNYEVRAVGIKKLKKNEVKPLPVAFGEKVKNSDLGAIKRQKMIVEQNIFNGEQICWGKPKLTVQNFEEDSVYYFAGGTLILKKVNLKKLPEHYQLFAELTQYSNGDAYDRTGSVFALPANCKQSFLQGLKDSMKVLPAFVDKNQKEYYGMVRTPEFLPAVELMRFFTSFGIKQYNERVKISGLHWEDSSVFKQDITDIKHWLEGEVYVGVFIGNYDRGGHKVSLKLQAYPGDYNWKIEEDETAFSEPLINTCNIMEMGGQTYATMFLTDTLSVDFEVPENAKNLRLRYISTGHGGWGGGDEFNPKPNHLFVNDSIYFTYTPWRTDCATHREYNPASGNFWNGMSSSDYSRSGWCPGTVTNPEYFYLPELKPGKHTLKIAIPMGEPQGTSFSAWSISVMLQGEKN